MLPDDVDTLAPRYNGLSADVKTMDDSRILAIWPGEPRSLMTYDGIRVEGGSNRGKSYLRLSTSAERPIELRRMWPDTDRLGDGWTMDASGAFAKMSLQVGPDVIEVTWPETQWK